MKTLEIAMLPLISVVMTVYNREAYLAEAIASVLTQTHPNFELVIWDDGSSDRSVEIAQSFARQDPRIRFIAAKHQGRVPALQGAIAQTTGEYLCWVDSDDWLAPTALAETLAALRARPEAGFVYTHYLDVDNNGKLLGYGNRCATPYSKERLLLDFMTFHFRLIRRSVFEQVGGIDTSLRDVEDYDLCLRLSEVAAVECLPKPLYYYRHHTNAISSLYRPRQVLASQQAIQRALERRGLAKHYVLSVTLPEGKFHLQKRRPVQPAIPVRTLRRNATSDRLPSFRSLAASIPVVVSLLPGVAVAQSVTPANDGTNTTVIQNGNQYTITGGQQSSNGSNLFQSFQQFGLNSGEIANFLATPQIQNILGRVTGGNASNINGLIQVLGSNANLYLVNPAGIVFGPNASLNVSGAFTATTATGIGFGNEWFNAIGANNYAALVGNPTSFAFALSQPGSIVNAGNLSVGQGQSLNLMGGTVVNTGTLTAPGGTITVTAVPGSTLVRLSQPGSLLSLDFQPSSLPQSSLTPASLPQLLTGGSITSATGLTVNPNGTVSLTGSGATIPTTPGTAIVSGTLNAAGNTTGGNVNVVGDRVAVVGGTIDASGNTGGGSIQVGGGYQGKGTIPNAQATYVSPDSLLRSDGIFNGTGGRIIIWSDQATRFYGTASIRGGSAGGDGGFAEISGKDFLDYQGTVDALAPLGQTGTLLLDPTNIEVVGYGYGYGYATSLADVDNFTDPDLAPGISRVSNTLINSATSNVILQATNDITFSAPVDITSPGVGLTAQARNNITVNQPITTSGGSIKLEANNSDSGAATGTGSIFLNAAITTGATFSNSGNVTLSGVSITGGGSVNTSANSSFSASNAGNISLTADNGNIGVGSLNASSSLTSSGFAYGAGYGAGYGGSITLSAPNGTITAGTLSTNSSAFFSGIGGSTSNVFSSAGGAVTLTASGAIAVDGVDTSSFVEASGTSGTTTSGSGGSVTMTSSTGTLTVAESIDTRSFVSADSLSGASTSGAGGNVMITSGSTLTTGSVFTGSDVNVSTGSGFGSTATAGNGGSLSLIANGGNLTTGALDTSSRNFSGSLGVGGALTLSSSNNISTGNVIIGILSSSSSSGGNSASINAPGKIAFASLFSSRANVTIGNTTTPSQVIFSNQISTFEATVAINTPSLNFGSGSFNATNSILQITSPEALTLSGSLPLSSSILQVTSPGALTVSTTHSLSNSSTVSFSGASIDATGTTFSATGSPSTVAMAATAGDLTTGDINLTSFGNKGSTLSLSATGSITTGDLNTSSTGSGYGYGYGYAYNGGNISLVAGTQVTTGIINTSSTTGSAGNVFIDPSGDVQVNYINAQGGSSGSGGTVDITAGQFFRATGTFTSSDGASSSISTIGGAGSGDITIRHRGSDQSIPFIVGDATTNGTAGQITSGSNTLAPVQSFDSSVIQGNVAILTGGGGYGPTPCIPPCNTPQPPTPTSTLVLPDTPNQVRNLLLAVQQETGVAPALVYVNFIPADLPVKADLTWREQVLSEQIADHLKRPDLSQPTIAPDPQPTDELEVLLVTANGEPIRKRLKGVTRKQVLQVTQRFINETSDPRRIRSTSYLRHSQQLYEWIIAPLAQDLENNKVQTLSFIMDQGLRFMPVAALHNGNQFLIEQYSVGLMPSLSLTDTRYTDLRDSQILAAGASQFETLPPLPAVPSELSAIFQDLWVGVTFLNKDFTFENLRKQRQERPFGIIHLATHAEFRPGDLTNSYIQLWNGRLRLDQLRQLGWSRPPVDLLVLSACTTALGDESAELGFAGFAVQAGVRSVLASLWYVSDEGTLGLMSEFYRQLRTAPTRGEALRLAQIAMLKGEVRVEGGELRSSRGEVPLPPELATNDDRTFSHPFFWASFTLVGNPW